MRPTWKTNINQWAGVESARKRKPHQKGGENEKKKKRGRCVHAYVKQSSKEASARGRERQDAYNQKTARGECFIHPTPAHPNPAQNASELYRHRDKTEKNGKSYCSYLFSLPERPPG